MEEAKILRIKRDHKDVSDLDAFVGDVEDGHQRLIDLGETQLRQSFALVPFAGHYFGFERIKRWLPAFPEFPFRDDILWPDADMDLFALVDINHTRPFER